jgi:hypothetical protein
MTYTSAFEVIAGTLAELAKSGQLYLYASSCINCQRLLPCNCDEPVPCCDICEGALGVLPGALGECDCDERGYVTADQKE